jgi:hypothetical protein
VLREISLQYGLKINASKTQLMVLNSPPETAVLDGKVIDPVENLSTLSL